MPKETKRARTRLPAEERRRQIVLAATELFRKRPYDEVSMDDIAEATQTTKPLITHHFGSKRGLYLAVIKRVLDVGTLPVPAYIHGMPLRKRLELSVDKWMDSNDRNRELWMDSMRAQGLGDPAVSEIVDQAREHAALQAAAVIGVGPPEQLTDRQLAELRIWGGVAEAATLQWLQYGRLAREETREIMLDSLEYVAGRLLDVPAADASVTTTH